MSKSNNRTGNKKTNPGQPPDSPTPSIFPASGNGFTMNHVADLLIKGLIVFGTLFLLRQLADVLIPFALAFILAYLLNPIVDLFTEKTGHRGISVFITLGGTLLLGIASVIIVSIVIQSQYTRFVGLATEFHQSIENAKNDQPAEPPPAPPDTTEDRPAKSVFGFTELSEGLTAYRSQASEKSRVVRLRELRKHLEETYLGILLNEIILWSKSPSFDDFKSSLIGQVSEGGQAVLRLFASAITLIVATFIVLMLLFFLLLEFPDFLANLKQAVPPAYREAMFGYVEEFGSVMAIYFRAQAVVAILTGVIAIIGFSLIGLPLGALLGVMLGFFAMIPYMQNLALLPGAMLAIIGALESGGSVWVSLGMMVGVFIVIQLIQDFVVVPKVMGDVTGLRPVAIILGVLIWGKLLGFLGILLAIPLTCLFIAYYKRWMLNQRATAMGG